MSLRAKINDDLKTAMKAGDKRKSFDAAPDECGDQGQGHQQPHGRA